METKTNNKIIDLNTIILLVTLHVNINKPIKTRSLIFWIIEKKTYLKDIRRTQVEAKKKENDDMQPQSKRNLVRKLNFKKEVLVEPWTMWLSWLEHCPLTQRLWV